MIKHHGSPLSHDPVFAAVRSSARELVRAFGWARIFYAMFVSRRGGRS